MLIKLPRFRSILSVVTHIKALFDKTTGVAINYSDGSSTLLAGISSTGFDAKKAFLDLSEISTIPIKLNGIAPETVQKRKTQLAMII